MARLLMGYALLPEKALRQMVPETRRVYEKGESRGDPSREEISSLHGSLEGQGGHHCTGGAGAETGRTSTGSLKGSTVDSTL